MNTRIGNVKSVAPMPPTSEDARAGMRGAPRPLMRAVMRMAPRSPRALPHAHPRAWREVVQAFAHDTAQLPLFSRLLAGQGLLLLGAASIYGALAWQRRHRGASSSHVGMALRPARAPHRPRPLLAGALAVTGLALAWAAAAFVARLHAIPAVTALFTYGHALRHYARPLRPRARPSRSGGSSRRHPR